MPSDAAYKVLDGHLKRTGTRIVGKRAPQIAVLDWKGTNQSAAAGEDIYPHENGEILLIEVITLK